MEDSREILKTHFNEIISITFYGRSGSIFLQSLLDNHPNVVTFPGIYLQSFSDWWNLNNYNHSSEYFEKFIKDYSVLFNPEESTKNIPGLANFAGLTSNFHRCGENLNESIIIDKEKFIDEFYKIQSYNEVNNCITFFKKIHYALAKTLNLKVNKDLKIVYQLHSNVFNRASFLFDNYTKNYFIHMVREPVLTAYSMSKHMKDIETPNIKSILKTMLNFSALPGQHNNTRAVRLEDIHLKPKKTLKKIVKFINISWSETLLESTFLGKKWYNLSGSKFESGFNINIIKKNKLNLNDFDKSRLEFLFKKIYSKWSYKIKKKHILLDYLYKFKIENNFFTYIKNRIFIFKIIYKLNKTDKISSATNLNRIIKIL